MKPIRVSVWSTEYTIDEAPQQQYQFGVPLRAYVDTNHHVIWLAPGLKGANRDEALAGAVAHACEEHMKKMRRIRKPRRSRARAA